MSTRRGTIRLTSLEQRLLGALDAAGGVGTMPSLRPALPGVAPGVIEMVLGRLAGLGLLVRIEGDPPRYRRREGAARCSA